MSSVVTGKEGRETGGLEGSVDMDDSVVHVVIESMLSAGSSSEGKEISAAKHSSAQQQQHRGVSKHTHTHTHTGTDQQIAANLTDESRRTHTTSERDGS